MTKNETSVKNGIFDMGDKNDAYAKYFVGQSYLNNLINDPKINVGVGNVTFEPGCRNNWHIHHDGFQLLLVTGGEGWYQEEGQPARKLHPGDVVVTHDGVKHWHRYSRIAGSAISLLQLAHQNGWNPFLTNNTTHGGLILWQKNKQLVAIIWANLHLICSS